MNPDGSKTLRTGWNCLTFFPVKGIIAKKLRDMGDSHTRSDRAFHLDSMGHHLEELNRRVTYFD